MCQVNFEMGKQAKAYFGCPVEFYTVKFPGFSPGKSTISTGGGKNN